MSEEDDERQELEEGSDENKENLDDSRAESSMTNSTFLTSGRIHNEKADVEEDGTLDLANLSLTNLERNFKEEYGKVKRLLINGNCIQKFTYTKLFPKCEIIDAQDCQINKFISDFNMNLFELYLSRNQLKEINQMGRFENLIHLDLSSNLIEDLVILSLKSLEILNLSSNFLVELPDLSKCKSLRSLNLAENKIKDLTKLPTLISPTTLRKFDISSNSISDLSQFSTLSSFKKLEEVALARNPCINDVVSEEKFDYRSYIVACCSETLTLIDEEAIDETVQTEGEWLAMEGKIKKIEPGNHEILCEQLTQHFPKADSGPPTPAQKTCHKALQKKRSLREESDDTDRTANSVYSPFREWNGKLGTLKTPGDSGNRKTQPVRNNIRMCSPPEARRNKSFTFQGNSPSKFVDALQLQKSTSTSSTETVICSARTELSFTTIDGRSQSTPLPIIDSTKPESPSNRRTPSVADVSYVSDETEDLKTRVKYLEQKVNELNKQNENLTAINDGLVETLESFKAEQSQMWKAIRSMIPTPQNLTNSFVCENEDGHHVHQVKWEMPLVKGYRIFVDGNQCGQIIGKNNSARITDLSANETHFVQIQPIGNNGEPGNLSKKLHINP
uniref:Fibronectin type-III domain-containing protein n=1 Tax=Caenorhabditis tropicalis TaxID=1561998 RepID=A0A1I7V1Z9_9PELO